MNTWVYCDHPPGRYQQTPRLAPWPEKLLTGKQQNEMGMHWVKRHGVKASGQGTGHPVCAEGAFSAGHTVICETEPGVTDVHLSSVRLPVSSLCSVPIHLHFPYIFLPVSLQTDDTSSLSRLCLHYRTSLLLWKVYYSMAFNSYTSQLSSLFLQGFSALASNLERSFPGRDNNLSFS